MNPFKLLFPKELKETLFTNRHEIAESGQGPYSAKQVANHIIHKANDEDGVHISPLKVINLVYLSHAWSLGIYRQPLLNQPVEAWKYGPMFWDLSCGMTDIHPTMAFLQKDAQPAELTANEQQLLEEVYDRYRDLDTRQLTAMASASGSPWAEAWSNRNPLHNTTYIADAAIQDYYSRMYQDLMAKEARETADQAAQETAGAADLSQDRVLAGRL